MRQSTVASIARRLIKTVAEASRSLIGAILEGADARAPAGSRARPRRPSPLRHLSLSIDVVRRRQAPVTVSNSSLTLSATMTAAMAQDRILSQRRDHVRAHLLPVRDEADERDDGEGQLHRQHHLAQHEQLRRPLLAVERGHAHHRHDGDARG